MDQNTGKVNYRDLISDLRFFDYDRATNEKQSNPISTNRSSAPSIPGTGIRKTIYDDDYIILDSQKVPPNTLE